jgi:hypothetical protein
VTEAASKAGVNSTPTVFIQGSRIEGHNGGALTAADVMSTIAAELKVAKSTAAPSPTPSVTPSSSAAPPANGEGTTTKPATPKPSTSKS